MWELTKFLDQIRVKELHFVLKDEAIGKKGEVWFTKHQKKVKKKLRKEKLFYKKTLKRIHSYLQKIKELFEKEKSLFSLKAEGIEKLKKKDFLAESEEEIKHILNKLIQFIFAYEHLFQEALKKH